MPAILPNHPAPRPRARRQRVQAAETGMAVLKGWPAWAAAPA
jgi:hypothetical protein